MLCRRWPYAKGPIAHYSVIKTCIQLVACFVVAVVDSVNVDGLAVAVCEGYDDPAWQATIHIQLSVIDPKFFECFFHSFALMPNVRRLALGARWSLAA